MQIVDKTVVEWMYQPVGDVYLIEGSVTGNTQRSYCQKLERND